MKPELKVIVLVGIPGSGKSTYADELVLQGYVRINQDTLGSRDACMLKAIKALKGGQSIVIDRCNHIESQRKHWLKLAKEFDATPHAVFLSVNAVQCVARVLDRKNHPTLTAEMTDVKKYEIVKQFADTLTAPSLEEGFDTVLLKNNTHY